MQAKGAAGSQALVSGNVDCILEKLRHCPPSEYLPGAKSQAHDYSPPIAEFLRRYAIEASIGPR